MEPKRSGYSGRYFIVLKWASENGLSSETWGRLCVLTTPRSVCSSARDWSETELREFEWDPTDYNPGNSIYLLLARDFAPLPERGSVAAWK